MASYNNRDYEDLTSLDQDMINQDDILWDLRRKDLIERRKKKKEENENRMNGIDNDIVMIEDDDDVIISNINNQIGWRMNFNNNNRQSINNNDSLIIDMDEQIARQLQEESDRELARRLEKEEKEKIRLAHRVIRNNISDLINLNSTTDITPPTATTITRPSINTRTNRNRNDLAHPFFQNLNVIANNHRHLHRHRINNNVGDDFTPEDYDRLLQLDETTKKKGLEKNELSQLASFEYKTSSDESNADSNNKACSICFEDFKSKEKLTAIACLHKFHKKCISQWLKDNRTCPLCIKDAITGK